MYFSTWSHTLCTRKKIFLTINLLITDFQVIFLKLKHFARTMTYPDSGIFPRLQRPTGPCSEVAKMPIRLSGQLALEYAVSQFALTFRRAALGWSRYQASVPKPMPKYGAANVGIEFLTGLVQVTSRQRWFARRGTNVEIQIGKCRLFDAWRCYFWRHNRIWTSIVLVTT